MRTRVARFFGALLLAIGWTSLLVAVLGEGLHVPEAGLVLVGVIVALSTFGLLWRSTRPLRPIAEVFVLGVLPAWGWVINHGLDACDGCTPQNRLLAEPSAHLLMAAYYVTAVAYAVARRRPQLPARVELLVGSLLLFGIGLCALLQIQFGPDALMGLVLPMIGLPLVAPAGAIAFYTVELVRRTRGAAVPGGAGERLGERAGVQPGIAAVAGLPVFVGAYAIVHSAFLGQGAQAAFTEACAGTFAQNIPAPGDCHYLCTVAAGGHPRLVRPLRLGTRRGQTILVNRQLSVANAFEDLLHTRWPRLGGVARATYDRVGLPVSRWIRSPWAADLVYVCMKPAEWGFYLVLLLVDHEDPERRIDRMYR